MLNQDDRSVVREPQHVSSENRSMDEIGELIFLARQVQIRGIGGGF
jgi:hypothetical protein